MGRKKYHYVYRRLSRLPLHFATPMQAM